jgi:hypothetical protein
MQKGTIVKIEYMSGEPAYAGRIGTVECIDDMGQLHGTWGGCALIPGEDFFHEATAAEIEEWERAKSPSYAPRRDVEAHVPCEFTTRAYCGFPARRIAGSVKVSRNDDPNRVRILGLRDGDCPEFVERLGGKERLHGLAIEIRPIDTRKNITKEIMEATVQALQDFESNEEAAERAA